MVVVVVAVRTNAAHQRRHGISYLANHRGAVVLPDSGRDGCSAEAERRGGRGAVQEASAPELM